MCTEKEKDIISIARKIDNLLFPPKTKEESEKWWNLLEELNSKLCEIDDE